MTTTTTTSATKQSFLAILERELTKHDWTKDPERWGRAKKEIMATLNGSKSCVLSESWAAAWKAIGMKGKPTYKGIHALPAMPAEASNQANDGTKPESSMNDWQPIETAPRDREIDLRGWYEPSAEAYRNGARSGCTYGRGRWLWGNHWSGIVGANPTHWRVPVTETTHDQSGRAA